MGLMFCPGAPTEGPAPFTGPTQCTCALWSVSAKATPPVHGWRDTATLERITEAAFRLAAAVFFARSRQGVARYCKSGALQMPLQFRAWRRWSPNQWFAAFSESPPQLSPGAEYRFLCFSRDSLP